MKPLNVELLGAAGWRAALEALTVALGDGAPPVVNQALDAIQPVVEALYRCMFASHRDTSTRTGNAALSLLRSVGVLDRLVIVLLALWAAHGTTDTTSLDADPANLHPNSKC